MLCKKQIGNKVRNLEYSTESLAKVEDKDG